VIFFVTGGSRGIGEAIVLEAARQGHDVAFTYHTSEDRAQSVLRKAQEVAPKGRFFAYPLDVRDSAAVEVVGDLVLDDLGTVHAVVANAGVNLNGLAVSMSDEDWKTVIDTNLTGSFYVCRQFLPTMMANSFGRIVLISSLGRGGVTGTGQLRREQGGAPRALVDARQGVRPKGHHEQRGRPGLLRHRHDARGDERRQQGVLAALLPPRPDGRALRDREGGDVPRLRRRPPTSTARASPSRADWTGHHEHCPRVGIERARVYPCSLALSMADLCAARGHDPADIRDVMMIDERSVNPPFEDPVTMAVNAARPMLTSRGSPRRSSSSSWAARAASTRRSP
jgi:NAD(P)-dependent dehydrogenase (short-subunit alcohol dehydrogenase family)